MKPKAEKCYALLDKGDGLFWFVDFNLREAERYKRGVDDLVPCMLVPIAKKRRAKR